MPRRQAAGAWAEVVLPARPRFAAAEPAARAPAPAGGLAPSPWPTLPEPAPLDGNDGAAETTAEAEHRRRLWREQAGEA